MTTQGAQPAKADGILTACPQCGGKLRINAGLVGKTVRCPKCAHQWMMTASAPPAAGGSSIAAPLDPSEQPTVAPEILGRPAGASGSSSGLGGSSGPGSSSRVLSGEHRIGTRLGQFQIVRILGRGGMGTVFEALDTTLDRAVALKVLNPELTGDNEAVQRFIKEAKTAAQLEHPNVVSIYQVGRDGNVCYLAMQLVKGGSASDLVKRNGPLPPAEAVRIVSDAARGLAAAHAMGLVHRDIKPANIIMGENGAVKVADFGLAKAQAGGIGQSLTAAGGVVGTPQYMSPEQCQGKPVDGRSDLYSLGATLYALLAGAAPFGGDNAPTILYKHVYEPIPDPRTLRADIPAGCLRVIYRAMAKSPDDRYANADEMIADLAAIDLGESGNLFVPPPAAAAPGPASAQVIVQARPLGPSPAARRRQLTMALAAAGGIVALACVMPLGLFGGGKADRPGPGPGPGPAPNPEPVIHPEPQPVPGPAAKIDPDILNPKRDPTIDPVRKPDDKAEEKKPEEKKPEEKRPPRKAVMADYDHAIRQLARLQEDFPAGFTKKKIHFDAWRAWDRFALDFAAGPIAAESPALAYAVKSVGGDLKDKATTLPPFGKIRDDILKVRKEKYGPVAENLPPLPMAEYSWKALASVPRGASRQDDRDETMYQLFAGAKVHGIEPAWQEKPEVRPDGRLLLRPQTTVLGERTAVYKVAAGSPADFDLRFRMWPAKADSVLSVVYRHTMPQLTRPMMKGAPAGPRTDSGPLLYFAAGHVGLMKSEAGKREPLAPPVPVEAAADKEMAVRIVVYDRTHQVFVNGRCVYSEKITDLNKAGELAFAVGGADVLLSDVRLMVFDAKSR